MKQLFNKLPAVWIVFLIYQVITIILILIFDISYLLSTGFLLSRGIIIGYILFRISQISNIPTKFKALADIMIIYLMLAFFYGETGHLNTFLFQKIDPVLVQCDEWIFGTQPSIWFSQNFKQKLFSELMFLGYFSYYLMPFVSFLAIWKYKNSFFEEFSFLVLTSYFIYYLIFIIFPAEGPQFYFPDPLSQIEANGPFAFIVKTIQQNAEAPTAAFPSSHIGITVILLILLFKEFKLLFKICLPFSIILLFSTIYIKAHYFIDVLAGLISGPLVLITNKYFLNKIYTQLKTNLHVHRN